MDKELLNNIKDVVIPVLQNVLTKQNFKGRGLSDALELEVDMNEIFRLAEKALDSQWIPVTYRPLSMDLRIDNVIKDAEGRFVTLNKGLLEKDSEDK